MPATARQDASEPPPQQAHEVPASESPAPAPAAAKPPPPPPKTVSAEEALIAEVLGRDELRWDTAAIRLGVGTRGAVRLQPEGADLGLADDKSVGLKKLVAIDDGPRPRVVTDEGGVRLMLYVDRDDAVPVALRRARLRPGPEFEFESPPQRGHVIVEPGTWVRALKRTGDSVRVRYSGLAASHSGWVDDAALGTTYVREPDRTRRSPQWPRRSVKRAATLRVKPGGASLRKLRHRDFIEVRPPADTGRPVFVEYTDRCEREITVAGFLGARDVMPRRKAPAPRCDPATTSLAPSWGDAKSKPRVEIEAGRFLLDADASVVVGCVLRTTPLADLGDGKYAVGTTWGPIPVRLAPEGLAGKCGTAL